MCRNISSIFGVKDDTKDAAFWNSGDRFNWEYSKDIRTLNRRLSCQLSYQRPVRSPEKPPNSFLFSKTEKIISTNLKH